MTPPRAIVLYRYESCPTYDRSIILLIRYQVFAETTCGYWVQALGGDRWISKTGRKRYAYPTTAEARINFTKRKERRKFILESQLRRVERDLAADFPEEPSE